MKKWQTYHQPLYPIRGWFCPVFPIPCFNKSKYTKQRRSDKMDGIAEKNQILGGRTIREVFMIPLPILRLPVVIGNLL